MLVSCFLLPFYKMPLFSFLSSFCELAIPERQNGFDIFSFLGDQCLPILKMTKSSVSIKHNLVYVK